MLKKPKNGVEGLIEWWTELDDTVHLLRNRKAVRLWEWKGIPHIAVKDAEGDWVGACFFINCDGKKRCLDYGNVTVNRYWWKDCFAKDDYRRITKVFQEVMLLAMCEGKEAK